MTDSARDLSAASARLAEDEDLAQKQACKQAEHQRV